MAKRELLDPRLPSHDRPADSGPTGPRGGRSRKRLHYAMQLARTVSIALLATALGLDATGSVEEELSLEQNVRFAEIIGVMRVTHSQPALFTFDGEVRQCSFIYRADVLEPLKGEGSRSEFFSAFEISPDRDYLVFLFSIDAGSSKQRQQQIMGRLSTDLENAERLCRWEANDLTTRQCVAALLKDSDAEVSTRWIEVKRLGFDRFATIKPRNGVDLVEWSEVRKRIQGYVDARVD